MPINLQEKKANKSLLAARPSNRRARFRSALIDGPTLWENVRKTNGGDGEIVRARITGIALKRSARAPTRPRKSCRDGVQHVSGSPIQLALPDGVVRYTERRVKGLSDFQQNRGGGGAIVVPAAYRHYTMRVYIDKYALQNAERYLTDDGYSKSVTVQTTSYSTHQNLVQAFNVIT